MGARRLGFGTAAVVCVVGWVLVFAVASAFAGYSPSIRRASVQTRAGSTATVTAVVQPEELTTKYWVEYGTPSEYDPVTAKYKRITPAVSIPSEPREARVEVHLSGLTPMTLYHFRFVASNSEGTVEGEEVELLTRQGFSEVASHSAALTGAVDPEGLATTYSFEYGTTTSYGHSIPVPAGTAEGTNPLSVEARPQGLTPGTVYHFRLVATNEHGTKLGADETFSTLPEALAGLPDGRGYEMVSPVAGNDQDVYEPNGANGQYSASTDLPFQAAADGDAMAYPGGPPAVGGTGNEGADTGNEYLATRAAGGGWSAASIEPPTRDYHEEPDYQAFSSELTVGILNWRGVTPLVAGAPAGGYPVLYTRITGDGSFHPLFTETPEHRDPEEFGAYGIFHTGFEKQVAFAGASSNFEHILFIANDALTANALDGGSQENNLYDSVDGQLSLVNVLPNGTTEPNAIFGAPVEPGESPRENAPDFSHVISADGSRVFWTALEPDADGEEEAPVPQALYMRENDTQPQSPLGAKGECTVPADACTVQVDASVGGGGRFRTASADGSKVLFTKEGVLYEYDANTGQTRELTPPGGGVQGVVGASEDGSYIYFIADGALASPASPTECEPEGASNQSGCNLYVLHEGEPVKFIAELYGGDDSVSPASSNSNGFGDWRPAPGYRTAEVTLDGRHLVFMSRKSLTGYLNEDDPEVFLYDFESGEGGHLACLSCKQSDESPTNGFRAAYIQLSLSNTYTERSISADGNRVFFDSIDSLVPQDTNGMWDVYEWERDGTGSCQDAGGCIYLLSSGTSTDNSYFADASASGDDVFFITRSQLVPQDGNENFDMYDARVGAAQPLAPAQCTGTGCQGVPFTPPIFATPASATFDGVGNFTAPSPLAKALVKKHRAKKPKHGKRRKRRRGAGKGSGAVRRAAVKSGTRGEGR